MSDTQAMARLFEYCEWANHRFLDAVARARRRDFARDLKGSHGGIRGTLVHTYGAEWIWHQRFGGISPAALPGEDQIQDLAALRERWSALEAERRVVARGAAARRRRARDRVPELQGRPLLVAALAAGAARHEPRQLPPRPGRGVPAPARAEAADDRSRRLRPRAPPSRLVDPGLARRSRISKPRAAARWGRRGRAARRAQPAARARAAGRRCRCCSTSSPWKR